MTDDRYNEAVQLLRRHWRHDDFRPGQWDVIKPALDDRDVLAILPTGGGKSVCYQIPALMKPGLTVVVSPLIALMQDQVAGLNVRGIHAAFINSSLSARAIEQRLVDAEYGRYKLLYVAPERLQSDLFMARAERLKVSLLVVDEAHCISEWGHNFRPSYLDIAEARHLLGNPPVSAVTATATPEVRNDILAYLDLHHPVRIIRGFDRPNIVWSVFRIENKQEKVREILKQVPGPGVIYAATRKHVREWTERLQSLGFSAESYHGGMDSVQRESAQNRWVDGDSRVVVATNAFGMGIDKPDVRFVIHVDIPATLEAYYQEAGRAGRDGRKSYAVLLFQESDVNIQKRLIDNSHPDVDSVRKVYDAVCNLAQIPMGSKPETMVRLNLDRVCTVAGVPVPKGRSSLEMLERSGCWTILPDIAGRGEFRFLQSADHVRSYGEGQDNPAMRDFVFGLMRTIPSEAYKYQVDVDLDRLARLTRLSLERLQKGLKYLQERSLVEWRPPDQVLRLEFIEPRVAKVSIDRKEVAKLRQRTERKLEAMLGYASSTDCRRKYLLGYFGESCPQHCGSCDTCLGRHRTRIVSPDDQAMLRQIMRWVDDSVPASAWAAGSGTAEHRIEPLVDWLVSEGYLIIESPLKREYRLSGKGREYLEKTGYGYSNSPEP